MRSLGRAKGSETEKKSREEKVFQADRIERTELGRTSSNLESGVGTKSTVLGACLPFGVQHLVRVGAAAQRNLPC